MSVMSPIYPRGPINITHHLEFLPDDGTVPTMPDWQCIHTPGHTRAVSGDSEQSANSSSEGPLDPRFANLRDDPRFQATVQKVAQSRR